MLENWVFRGMVSQFIPEPIYKAYLNHFKDPAVMHAMCEDYRAGATIDLEHDETDIEIMIKGPKLIGIRSLECNYNPIRKTYNPHFYILRDCVNISFQN